MAKNLIDSGSLEFVEGTKKTEHENLEARVNNLTTNLTNLSSSLISQITTLSTRINTLKNDFDNLVDETLYKTGVTCYEYVVTAGYITVTTEIVRLDFIVPLSKRIPSNAIISQVISATLTAYQNGNIIIGSSINDYNIAESNLIISNNNSTYLRVGTRIPLSDFIANVSPSDTVGIRFHIQFQLSEAQ